MSLYLHHHDYFMTGNPLGKDVDVVEFITEELSPATGDRFAIMDPYLLVVPHIQEPFLAIKTEETIWSFLINELSQPTGVDFRFISTKEMRAIRNKAENPPYLLTPPPNSRNVKLEACYYVEHKFCDMGLHDRFILRSRDNEVAGLHIGPSLTDIQRKDISITKYSPDGARKALRAFNHLWDACITSKEWKTR